MWNRGQPPWLSVIIPTLEESCELPRQLDTLSRFDWVRQGQVELIVSDGRSRDGSADIARRFDAVRVVDSPSGRATQLNAGARAARGAVLLFLHADVSLPPHGFRRIAEAFVTEGPALVGGAFRTWHRATAPAPPWAPLLHLADVRSRYSGLPYGDQAMFVRASIFEELGGFPEIPLMEDLELSRQLRRRGRVVTLDARVEVSGRRFQERPIYYTALVNLFPLLYRAGVPAERLAQYYRHVR